MSPTTSSRCAGWFWIIVSLVVAATVSPGVRAGDPVESVKQALQITVEKGPRGLEARARRLKMVEAAMPDLRTIAQLRATYFMGEWQQVEAEDNVQKLRSEIGDRLVKALTRTAQEPDVTNQLSVAMWIGQVIPAEQGEQPDANKIQFARSLTPVVLGLLKSKDLSVRRVALHALGRIAPAPTDAFPALKKAVRDDEVEARRLAAYALTDLLKNFQAYGRHEQFELVEEVIQTASISLRDADEWTRGYSLQAILEAAKAFKDNLVVSSAGKGLFKDNGTDIAVRGKDDKFVLAGDIQKIMQALQTTMPQLVKALDDPRVKVRLSSLETLDHIVSARAKIVEKLRELNRVPVEKQESASQILKAFEAPDPLASIVERDWPYITKLLKDNDERLRRGAIDFLEVLGAQAEPALPAITEALRDHSHFVRWGAARTLRHMPPKKVGYDAVRALGFLLMDPDPDVSLAAAETLQELGPAAEPAVDALGHLIANSDPEAHIWDAENRIAAMRALASIGPERTARAIPKLASALQDQDPRIRRQAAYTLGLYGPAARNEIGALMPLLRDSDDEVKRNAAEAILAINAPAAKR